MKSIREIVAFETTFNDFKPEKLIKELEQREAKIINEVEKIKLSLYSKFEEDIDMMDYVEDLFKNLGRQKKNEKNK